MSLPVLNEHYFRSIGSRAQDADDQAEIFEGAVVNEDGQTDHPVQQIESLCMDCGENVRDCSVRSIVELTLYVTHRE